MAERTYLSAPAVSSEDFNFVEELVSDAHFRGENWALSWNNSAVTSEIALAETWIARDDSGRPLGFAFVRPPGASWEITLVAIERGSRGSGIFRVLLASIQKQIARSFLIGSDASIAELDLEVRADNRSAIRAYEKNGFLQIGRRKGYYSDGVDALLYRFKT